MFFRVPADAQNTMATASAYGDTLPSSRTAWLWRAVVDWEEDDEEQGYEEEE